MPAAVGKSIRLLILNSGYSERTATAAANVQAIAGGCIPRQLVRAERETEIAKNLALADVLMHETSRIKSLMADPNLAALLNANSLDDKRLDDANSKNSAAMEARKRRAQMEKDESNGELDKSRSALRDALKKVTR
jgi:hypothetical protein